MPLTITNGIGERAMKKQSSEMPILRQERFPSPNPDLGMSNSIPRSTEHDLIPGLCPCTENTGVGECTYSVPKPGNRPSVAGKDGKS